MAINAQTIPSRRNDELLKGVLEDNFQDFLRFLYPDADERFDLSRGVAFLDKELLDLTPDRDNKKGRRVTDLRAKVFLTDGTEEWIMLHTEIEGGRGAGFAERMLHYNYHIWHKHRHPVASIAFYTGGPKRPRPREYRREVLDTLLHFRYRAYHILDHSAAELLAMGNPFALVVMACQKALYEGKMPDAELGRERLMIARELFRGGYDQIRVIGLLVFLKNFLYVRNPEINRTFDEELVNYSGGTITMGVIEVVRKQQLQMERQMGWQEGKEEERAKVKAEKNRGRCEFQENRCLFG